MPGVNSISLLETRTSNSELISIFNVLNPEPSDVPLAGAKRRAFAFVPCIDYLLEEFEEEQSCSLRIVSILGHMPLVSTCTAASIFGMCHVHRCLHCWDVARAQLPPYLARARLPPYLARGRVALPRRARQTVSIANGTSAHRLTVSITLAGRFGIAQSPRLFQDDERH